MKNKFLILPLLLILSACSFGSSSSSQPKTAELTGFYTSSDAGATWNFKSSVYTVDGQKKTFAGSSVTALELDPNDPNTVYIGTNNRGLLYSLNAGVGWTPTSPGTGVVNSIAVNPFDKCTVYAAVHNKIYKTEDCARTWKTVHFSSLEGEYFSTIVVDPNDTNYVYLGSSRGAIIRSTDAGFSWQVIKFLSGRVAKLIINPNNSSIIYAATASSGIFQSVDRGVEWENLLDRQVQIANEAVSGSDRPLKKLKSSNSYINMAFDYSQENGLIHSNTYGIFRLLDNGNWQEIFILNKPKLEKVLAVDVNPLKGNEIYFTTDGAFYKSSNSGVDWTVTKLPKAGSPNQLRINPQDGKTIYLGYYLAAK